MIIGIGSVFLLAGLAGAGVVFQETFPAPDDNSPMTNVNWNAAVTAKGTVYTGTSGYDGPILSNSGFLYTTGTGRGVAGGPWLAWTEKAEVGAIGSIGDVADISVTLRNASTREGLKIAIKVDGSWYVSQEMLNNAVADAWQDVSLDVQSAVWNKLSFISGLILIEGEAVGALSGPVQAVGVFDARAGDGRKVRIDNFTVEGLKATNLQAEADNLSVSDKVIMNPGAEGEDNARTWQGIPGIERAPNGRLWATWYTGGLREGYEGNYVVAATSGDDGKTWSKPVVLVKGSSESILLADPLPWIDPMERLWIFYLHADRQKGSSDYFGACAVRNDSPNDADGSWSDAMPVHEGGRIFGKPLILPDGSWLAPFFRKSDHRTPEVKETCTLISSDEGDSWTLHGGTSVPLDIRNYSEATLARRNNGDLWTVMRTLPGLYESTSCDEGLTWSDPVLMREGPNARACMMRLASGAFLLVYHDVERESANGKFPRARLTAWLSDDEGRTWPYKLLLDDREQVTYPDALQAPDGSIYIAYDYRRYGDPHFKPGDERYGKEILMAVICEEDIRAGEIISPDSRLRQLINRATGIGNLRELPPD